MLCRKAAKDIAKALRKIKGAADVKVAQTEGLPAFRNSIHKESQTSWHNNATS